MATKKTKSTKAAKPANDTKVSSPFLASAWQNGWELADDTRAELHKQTDALIRFVDGALRGVTGFATNLNDRADRLAKEGITSASRTGLKWAVSGQEAAAKLIDSSKSGAAQVAVTTREVSDRANEAVRAIVTPSKAA